MERSNVRLQTIDWYLEKIEDMEWIEFDCIKVGCTAGSYRVPYAHQFVAYTKVRPGDDDPFEGVGGSPIAAVRDLWRTLKKVEQEPDPLEEEESLADLAEQMAAA